VSRRAAISWRDRDPALFGALCALPAAPLFALIFGLRNHSVTVGLGVGLVALALIAGSYPLGRALERRSRSNGETGFAAGLDPQYFPEVRHALRHGEPPADPMLADAVLYSAQRTLVLTGRAMPVAIGVIVLEVLALVVTVVGYHGDPQRLAADLLSIFALTCWCPLLFRRRNTARRAEQSVLQMIEEQELDDLPVTA
jgi:hypothetical protein